MTRKNAKELLPIIKAYSEGKKIEFLNSGDKWELLTAPSFDSEPFRYRIKPEPKYRPFKNAEECWEEMKKHQPFGWIIDVNGKYYHNINLLGKNTDFNYLFKIHTFADGTPFGIKEEE